MNRIFKMMLEDGEAIECVDLFLTWQNGCWAEW